MTTWKTATAAIILALASVPAWAEPKLMPNGFACFDYDSFVDFMADVEQKRAEHARKMFPERCVSAETVNRFHLKNVRPLGRSAATFEVDFPNSPGLKMYTLPGAIIE